MSRPTGRHADDERTLKRLKNAHWSVKNRADRYRHEKHGPSLVDPIPGEEDHDPYADAADLANDADQSHHDHNRAKQRVDLG